MNKVYVGNLSFKTAEADIEDLFKPCGEITKVNLIRDRETGRSRGFAFVEFTDASQAEKAVNDINGQEFQGRQLRVNIAKEQERRSGGGGRREGGRRQY